MSIIASAVHTPYIISKHFSRKHFEIFSYFHQKIEFDMNRKVPSDIIYTRNNLLHLDPGLFQN